MIERWPVRGVTIALACFGVFHSFGCEQGESTDGSTVRSPDSTTADTASSPTVPKFTDVLPSSGITHQHHFLDSETGTQYRINPYDHGSGVYVADVNGDGLDDIYFLDFLGPNALYVNRGDWVFEDVTEASGLAVDRAISVGAAFGDMDNDGDQDVYVTTYRGGNHLFRNNGDGTFEESTESAGVGYNGHSSAATWFDYDLDGDLDLYLCNIGKFTTETISREADYFYRGTSLPFSEIGQTPDHRVPGEKDILYRNNGDGTFTDVTELAGIDSGEWNGDVAVADIDLDGYPDVYTSNMFGKNHLFRNRGDGTFEDITDAALKRTSWGGMGCRFFDANGDSFADLFVVDMHSDMWSQPDDRASVRHTAKFNTPFGSAVAGGKPIESPDDTRGKWAIFGNTFFTNNGDGTFAEKSAEAGLETWWPWGITIGDYNNDGSEDVFVASGMGYPYFYWPNRLFLNDGTGRFDEVGSVAGIEPPRLGPSIRNADIRGKPFTRSSRSAATADFDGDGDLDIVVNNFNHEPYLLRNDSAVGNCLRLHLRGSRSNRDAIGARVEVKTSNRTWYRDVVNAQGYLTQSSHVVHIGLGDVASVASVKIHWPGQKEPQTILSPALNEVVEIVQQ